MNLPAPWRALRRLTGWALPILAGLLVAPADARANCGDYVVTRLSQAGVTMPEHPGPAGQLPPLAPRPHPPCSGPRCSETPAAPPAPVPATPTQASQEWGSLLDALAFAAPGATGLLGNCEGGRVIHLCSDIFHPPRLVA